MKLEVDKQEKTTPTQPAPRRRRVRLIIALSLLVLILAGSGLYVFTRPQVQPFSLPAIPAHLTLTDLGLANWQEYRRTLPTNALNSPMLPASPQVNKNVALLEDAAGQELIHQGQLEHGLAYLQAAALSDPDNLRLNNDFRLALRNNNRFAQEEAFFTQQAKKIKSANTSIGLALAYVDEMRSCPRPPDGLVCQAQDSSHSISTLTEVLALHPYNIIARYARGLNNLYWPSLMGHLPQAQEDLQYAIALLRPLGSVSGVFSEQAYTALGDVFAKDGKIDKARNIWQNGEIVVPNSSLLNSRLNIPQDQLVNMENNQLRGLGVYVETDIAIFWQTGR
jgi:tetratricopeptide (TPR) repeat protein